MSKIEVSKIVLEVGGKTIELSLKEARELKEILTETFPAKEVVYRPHYIERWCSRGWPYETWYSTTSKGAVRLCSGTKSTAPWAAPETTQTVNTKSYEPNKLQ